jgi:hypothetical protein
MSEKGDVPFWGSYAVNPNAPVQPRGKGTPPVLKLTTGKGEVAEEGVVGATLDELARYAVTSTSAESGDGGDAAGVGPSGVPSVGGRTPAAAKAW